ncbi:MAG TPA: lysylphosphatidylglycerol synthase transmembrane domain-containing protein, partial [bacterium]|nr:lysylphosphatidylglycerol synthase transmembrane domain-containing protein [bacterium]
MFKKKGFWIAIIVLVIFYFMFRHVDFNKLLDAIAHFQLIWLLPALVIYLLGYLIRGYRWVVLLSPIKKCTFTSLFPTLIIGFMANNILPARAGELVRAHLNGTKEGISRSASLATIILERLFDGLTMILVLWATLQFGNLPIQKDTISPGVKVAMNLAPYVFGSLFLVLFILVLFKQKTVALINFILKFAPQKLREPLGKIAHTFLDGLQILQSAKESLIVLSTSVAAWFCEFSAY